MSDTPKNGPAPTETRPPQTMTDGEVDALLEMCRLFPPSSKEFSVNVGLLTKLVAEVKEHRARAAATAEPQLLSCQGSTTLLCRSMNCEKCIRLRAHQKAAASPVARPQAKYRTDERIDEDGLQAFTEAMRKKLSIKRAEGYYGWNDPAECSVEHLAELLIKHVPKGDPIDIANFCMMLWNRGGQDALKKLAAPEREPAPRPTSCGCCGKELSEISEEEMPIHMNFRCYELQTPAASSPAARPQIQVSHEQEHPTVETKGFEPAAQTEQPTPPDDETLDGQLLYHYPDELAAPVAVVEPRRELSDDERMAIQVDKILKRFGTIDKFFEYMNEQAGGRK